jgi:DNA-binding NarL/FixJ family response regulator
MAGRARSRDHAGMESVLHALRALVVEDHLPFSQFLVEFLEAHGGVKVVAATGSGEMAVGLALAHDPHLALVDINLRSGVDGLEATRRLKLHAKRTHVVILTSHDLPEYRAGAAEAGADGYVLKDEVLSELPFLIRRLQAGRTGR